MKFARRLRAIGEIALAIVLVLRTAPALAQASWQMATEYPQSSVSGTGLVNFAKLVATRTGGAVTMTPAFDNELKVTSRDMPRAAKDGRISGGDAFAGALSGLDPVFGLSTLPFVVPSVEVARALNAKARPLYERALQAQGLKLLYLTIWPSTGLVGPPPRRRR